MLQLAYFAAKASPGLYGSYEDKEWTMVRVTALLITASATTAFAQEVPQWGQLYGLDERSSLAYECTLLAADQMRCIFGQTNVWETQSSEDIEVLRHDMAAAQAAGETIMPADQCPVLQDAAAAMERGEAPAEGQAMSADEIAAALPMVRVLAEVCGRSDPEAYNRATEMMVADAEGQCSIRTQTFEQTFVRTTPDTWVNAAPPTGECGIVRLDRFQRDPDALIPDMNGWMYVAEKRVMGSGDPVTDEARLCTGLDEAPYRYVTTMQTHLLDCRAIRMEY
jgi:hypothetical protein